MITHSLLSPSSASRWMSCPGSVALTKDLPNIPGPSAEYGTIAHSLAEAILKDENLPTSPLIDETMIEGVNKYVEHIASLRVPESVLYIEKRLSLEKVTGEKNAGGTADAIILNPNDLIVIDLKMGYGKVSIDTPQLKIYALVAMQEFNRTTATVMVFQPLIDHFAHETFTLYELEAWRNETLQPCANIALQMVKGEIPMAFSPSYQSCQWCRGKAHCPALAEEMFDAVQTDPQEVEIDEFASKIALVRLWADGLEERIIRALEEGQTFKTVELGYSRPGNRKWIDEKAAEETLKLLLGSKAYTQKLISPTQAAKICPETGDLELLITREPGKAKIIYLQS